MASIRDAIRTTIEIFIFLLLVDTGEETPNAGSYFEGAFLKKARNRINPIMPPAAASTAPIRKPPGEVGTGPVVTVFESPDSQTPSKLLATQA
jgi:hypothetical protein